MTTSTDSRLVRLGRSDLMISRVGVGCWAIGGRGARFTWGDQSDDDSIAAIHRAVDLGVNWVDTAPIYGLGHSEEVVGRALRQLPAGARPYVFTKGGLRWDETARSSKVGAADSLTWEVEQSLRRLGVERIDLYQMHWPAEDVPIEDYWATLLGLVDAGKVGAVGLSNHGPAELERARALGPVTSVQPLFSAIHRDAAADLLPWCDAHDTGVVVYQPLQAGLLTGSFTPERLERLRASDDWRARSDDFREPALSANLALAAVFAEIAAERGASTPAAAVAWTLSFPGVTGAIVGARSPAQVDDWIAAQTLRLTDAELDRVAAAIDAHGTGSGPARPAATA